MDHPTDGSFSNMTFTSICINAENSGALLGGKFKPFSVFDLSPDHGAGKYRQVPLVRFNSTRGEHEIHPYFFEMFTGSIENNRVVVDRSSTMDLI